MAGAGEGFALEELGYVFTGTDKPKIGGVEVFSLRYAEFSELGSLRDFLFQLLDALFEELGELDFYGVGGSAAALFVECVGLECFGERSESGECGYGVAGLAELFGGRVDQGDQVGLLDEDLL